uniref:Uncharacterized protein n=1 Tax=Oryza barthii TaxID=65489 RepID=A0A0D3GYV2_9ORYZ
MGMVDDVRGEWEAVMWVPEGVGPTVSERNSKIALEAKSKRVACQGSLEGIQGVMWRVNVPKWIGLEVSGLGLME